MATEYQNESLSEHKIELFKRLIQGDMSVYDELFPDAKEGDRKECENFLERINNLETPEGVWWWFVKFILANIDCCTFPSISTEVSKDPIFREFLVDIIKGDNTSAINKLNEYLDEKAEFYKQQENIGIVFSECCIKALTNKDDE